MFNFEYCFILWNDHDITTEINYKHILFISTRL